MVFSELGDPPMRSYVHSDRFRMATSACSAQFVVNAYKTCTECPFDANASASFRILGLELGWEVETMTMVLLMS